MEYMEQRCPGCDGRKGGPCVCPDCRILVNEGKMDEHGRHLIQGRVDSTGDKDKIMSKDIGRSDEGLFDRYLTQPEATQAMSDAATEALGRTGPWRAVWSAMYEVFASEYLTKDRILKRSLKSIRKAGRLSQQQLDERVLANGHFAICKAQDGTPTDCRVCGPMAESLK